MRGFGLLELLISLAIAATLAALAIPGYAEITRRSLRQDARLALMRIHYRQEQYFAMHHAYAGQLEAGIAGDALGLANRSDGGHYLLQLEASGDGYVATATADPAGRQSGDAECAAFTIDESGRRRSADAGGQWQEEGPGRCWG